MLGIDGMDPDILRRLMDAGRMPHCERLARRGDFRPLATSVPPQSPVAWSNVIAGCGPGTHEIYDFIHRDPHPREPGLAVRPYHSTSTVEPPASDRQISLGKWRIPLASETTRLRRQGPTFWQYLVKNGVNAVVYRIPANYPAQPVEGQGQFHCLCGMGTPDLLGSYGEFTLFSPDAPAAGRKVAGGRLVRLRTRDDRAEGQLEGPRNFLRKREGNKPVPRMTIAFVAVRDPDRKLIKLTLGEHTHVLKEGEWSPWLPFSFNTEIPGGGALSLLGAPTSLAGMVRFHVKQVHPDIVLFATPINIDPTRPVNPISVPNAFAKDLALATGLYYTAGIPEHAPEVQGGGLDEDQWLEQVKWIQEERTEQFRHALEQFDSGCLFFYFGTVDLLSHIFWRDQDPGHPGRDPRQEGRYAHVIDEAYVAMDKVIGESVARLGPRDTLIVLSDHGFTGFRRGFNLNRWLVNNGYMTLLNVDQPRDDLFTNVDWKRTSAYGLGLNGLYINLRGREKRGVVNDGPPKAQLIDEIRQRLLEVRDVNGETVIAQTDLVSELYPDADPEIAPDILVGYARNYRASWSTVLGGMAADVLEDNHDRWSGDHCVAAHLVPGILISNRRVTVSDPSLADLGPTILSLFGLTVPREMTGRMVFAAE